MEITQSSRCDSAELRNQTHVHKNPSLTNNQFSSELVVHLLKTDDS